MVIGFPHSGFTQLLIEHVSPLALRAWLEDVSPVVGKRVNRQGLLEI
jgi:hypothetical protein